MSEDARYESGVHQADGKWTFACDKCTEVREADTEGEALNHAKNHLEYGFGSHFSFTISDPEGVIRYGE